MPTQKDVANAAGVTPTTVSLILNGKAKERHIHPETVARVMEAMKELGYQPNTTARRLRSSGAERPIFALYWPADSRIRLCGDFIYEIQQVFAALSFDCELVIQTYEKDRLQAVAEGFQKGIYNGVIISGCSAADLVFLEDCTPMVPVVLIDRYCEKYSTVGVDNSQAGRSVARLIHESGCPQAAVIRADARHIGQTGRFNAFLEGCRELGIQIRKDWIIQIENNVNGGALAAEQLCSLNDRPPVLVCETDNLALGALVVLRQKGIRIPGEMKMLCFGFTANDTLAYQSPSISTITMPVSRMCRATAEILIHALSHREYMPVHVLFNIDIHLRESFSEIQEAPGLI